MDRTVCAVGTCFAAAIFSQFEDWANPAVQILVTLWLIFALLADITITVTLVWDLVSWFASLYLCTCSAHGTNAYSAQMKRRTGYRSTDIIVNQLIRGLSFLIIYAQFPTKVTQPSGNTNRDNNFPFRCGRRLVMHLFYKNCTFFFFAFDLAHA